MRGRYTGGARVARRPAAVAAVRRPWNIRAVSAREPRPDESAWRRPAAVAGALAAAVALVYLPVAGFEFVEWDDPAYVTENPAVRAGLTRAGVVWAFTTAHAANWHPLTWLSHMADWSLFGPWAGGHHLTSLVLHVLATVLMFRLWWTATGAVGPSALVAALFGLHPLHVESVAWVAERKDVLCAVATLLSLQGHVDHARGRGRWGRVRAFVWLAVALLAKPMAVTLPALFLLLDAWPLGRLGLGARRLVHEKVPFVALVVAASAVTLWAQERGGAVAAAGGLDAGTRVANALVSYVAYLFQAVWPARLSFFYPYPAHLPWWQPAGAAMALAVVTAAAAALRHGAPYLLVGWLWYLGMLVPVIGLVQVGDQARADRYTYLPLTGVFVMAAWGGAALAARWRIDRRLVATVTAVVLAAYAAAAAVQMRTWRTSRTLFEHALAIDPANPVAHNLLGFLEYGARRYDRAARHFAAAVAARPTMHEAHSNLGLSLAVQGRPAGAIPHYERALALRPDYATATFNLAIAQAATGQAALADATAARALALAARQGDAALAGQIGAWRAAQAARGGS
jgi:tetratricopeptide (TPR) repeat protein